MSATGLSAETAIPVPTVSKILGTLSREGILISGRGLKGGFGLARPAKDISVADIVEAIDGPIALTACIEDDPCNCDFHEVCLIQPRWEGINNAVHDALASVHLDQVSRPPHTSAPV